MGCFCGSKVVGLRVIFSTGEVSMWLQLDIWGLSWCQATMACFVGDPSSSSKLYDGNLRRVFISLLSVRVYVSCRLLAIYVNRFELSFVSGYIPFTCVFPVHFPRVSSIWEQFLGTSCVMIRFQISYIIIRLSSFPFSRGGLWGRRNEGGEG